VAIIVESDVTVNYDEQIHFSRVAQMLWSVRVKEIPRSTHLGQHYFAGAVQPSEARVNLRQMSRVAFADDLAAYHEETSGD
jgi:hypothetical protein